MNPSEAVSIVRSHANGVDPAPGEGFPGESPYQRAEIVRALFAAAEALERYPHEQSITWHHRPQRIR